jgi:hypothetical protein
MYRVTIVDEMGFSYEFPCDDYAEALSIVKRWLIDDSNGSTPIDSINIVPVSD